MSQRACSLFLLVACLLVPRTGLPQGLTGTLIGTVRDEQGGLLPGAQVTLSSPALNSGPANSVTNEKGQLRFQALPPGLYTLEVRMDSFTSYRDDEVAVGAGATIERLVVLTVAGIAVAVDVEGARASRPEAAASRRASAPTTSGTSRDAGSACSTS